MSTSLRGVQAFLDTNDPRLKGDDYINHLHGEQTRGDGYVFVPSTAFDQEVEQVASDGRFFRQILSSIFKGSHARTLSGVTR